MMGQRGHLLRAALGFAGCSMPSYDGPLHALRSWLDSWSGIGGMHRQGYDLQLTQYRRSRVACDVLHDRDGAFSDERDGLGVGAHAVACGPGRSEGGVE
jgi:hypothetical protein